MAKSKFPKTNGVKEAVPAREVQPSDIQQATPQPSAAFSAPTLLAEPAMKADARKPNATKNPAAKFESARSERGTVVPINLEDEIRRLAYLLSEHRGFEPGHENEDWLTAEHEVLQRYRQHVAQSA